jgi:hypothetical protein
VENGHYGGGDDYPTDRREFQSRGENTNCAVNSGEDNISFWILRLAQDPSQLTIINAML